MRHFSYMALILLATGCSHWEQRPLDEPTPIKPSVPVWIWRGADVEKWHAVVITPDSVSGIPDSVPVMLYGTSLNCDSCRRSIPRAQVDSMKVGYLTGPPKGVKTALRVTAAVAAILLVEVVLCSALAALRTTAKIDSDLRTWLPSGA